MVSACSTDVEVNAPYKELPIVYALFNAADSVQYVRITKGFQNRGGQNAYDLAAQNPDSSLYDEGEIKVELFLLNGTTETLANTLQRTVLPKARSTEGDFFTSPNVLYRTTNGFQMQTRVGGAPATYKLKITNLRNGHIAEATTAMVGDFVVEVPKVTADPNTPSNFIMDNPRVIFYREKPASIYRVTLNVNYIETVPGVSTVSKNIYWAALPLADARAGFGTTENQLLGGNTNSFYTFLQQNIDTTRDSRFTERRFSSFEFTFYAGTAEYRDFLAVSNSYSELAQSKPPYPNVVNGLGIVSSRYKKVLRTNNVSVSTRLTRPDSKYKSLKFKQ
jgi:hypothetical protein